MVWESPLLACRDEYFQENKKFFKHNLNQTAIPSRNYISLYEIIEKK